MIWQFGSAIFYLVKHGRLILAIERRKAHDQFIYKHSEEVPVDCKGVGLIISVHKHFRGQVGK